jgi:tripartite-type tricarboxylate transporter receptor subunit TctC
MLMPSGTPNPVVAKMSLGIHDALLEPAIKSAIIEMGLEPIGSTPEEFAAVIGRDYLRWRQLITEVGVIPEAQ